MKPEDSIDKEELIQQIVPQLQKQEPDAIQQFFEIFSDEIYNFPIRYYNFGDDEAGDYYLYAFEHLKNGKKFVSFKNKSRFTTWFFSVLRNLLIDFLRSQKKKVQTTTFFRTDANGNIIDTLENIADIDEHIYVEDEILNEFNNHLDSLKIAHRILFKLAYIHYIDLTEEELTWLMQNNNKNRQNIIENILYLKDVAQNKSEEVREIEDKLTANFQAITILENKIERYLAENPHIAPQRTKWNEDFEEPGFSPEATQWIQSLMKKKKKHQKLLKSQHKSLLSTRVAYKEIAPLLNSSEGVLSVQLIRILEKLNHAMNNFR